MRVTVCELPHEPEALEAAWAGLCGHTRQEATELVLLPELVFVEPLWCAPAFDAARWRSAERQHEKWLARLPELGAAHVVGTRPWSSDGKRLNQGYRWSAPHPVQALRSKWHLPDEPQGWERRWFDAGDPEFPAFTLETPREALTFALNICTELWALDTYAQYAQQGVQLLLCPRATAKSTVNKWLAAGTAGAVRTGAFSASSNRTEPSGACGGMGWILDPDGHLLGRTDAANPFLTVDIDLAATHRARTSYPRNVFNLEPAVDRLPPHTTSQY